MNQYSDIIIIGAGAAGMTSAIKAAERNLKVILLEKSDRAGRKILASGNGRCNLMNSGVPRYFGDPVFAQKVLSINTGEKLKQFFYQYGLMLTEEDEGRIYPTSFQSASVLSVLKNALKLNSVEMKVNTRIVSVRKENERFSVQCSDHSTYQSHSLIIACGGAAQPKLGGTYDGYSILQSMGHSLIPVRPSLVSLNTDSKSISGLSGIRIRCGVSLFRDEECLHSETGEVLFTDYGISGICIMQCSRFVNGPDTVVVLDLLNNTFSDKYQAVHEMKRRKTFFPDNSPIWLLNGILPDKVSYAVMKQAGLPMHGESLKEIDDSVLEDVIDTACAYRIYITGTRGFDYAQVTAGGISCDEFDPSTMESKLVKGLYASGEVLNVDGDCGGFNLMFAFASGMAAGCAVH